MQNLFQQDNRGDLMLTSFDFKDKTVQCPQCGCTTMLVTESCQVTETLKNGVPVRVEQHNPKITLICRECNTIVREYDPTKIVKTGE